MFENYDDAARRSLVFARDHARRRKTRKITPEHLLLGILQENSETLRDIADTLHADLGRVAWRVEQIIGEPIPMAPSDAAEIKFSSKSKSVLDGASSEASRLAHDRIGPAHLLLGLLNVENTPMARLLTEHGFTLKRVRPLVSNGLAADLTGYGGQGLAGDLMVVWDPGIVDPVDYATLVKALGDLARANGALGVTRAGSATVLVGALTGVRT